MKKIRFKGKKQLISLGLVLLLLTSPLATISVGAETTTSFGNDETIRITDNVDVWERSILPLRTDTSDATTQIPNADWKLSVENPEFDSRLNKSTLGVFDANQTITVNFDSYDADQELSGQVHLVAARVDPSGDHPSNVSEAMTMLNVSDQEVDDTNVTEAKSRLDSSNRSDFDGNVTEVKSRLDHSDINNNVTFYSADTATLNDGSTELSFTPPESGQYVLFLALGDTEKAGLSVKNHDLSVTEQTTIVGVDYALVQQDASTVKLKNDEPNQGDPLRFDVESSLQGDVRHAILVYDETTGWTYQDFTLGVSDSPSNLSELAANTTLNHSVDTVGGVARTGSNVSVLGYNPSDSVTGTTPSLGYMFDMVGANAVSTAAPDNGGSYINASVTVREGSPETIRVDTLDNWAGSERYRWIHVAVNETGAMQTDTSSFELDRADVSVTEASVSPSEITPGEQVTITATVENTGDWRNTTTVSLYQNDDRVAGEEVSLGPIWDESNVTTVTFTKTLSESGDYEFRVGGPDIGDAIAGTVTVEAASGGGSSPPAGGGGGGGGGSFNPPSTGVDENQQSDGSVVADINNGRAGSPITIGIPSKQATRVSGVTFENLNVALQNNNAHFKFTINTFATKPPSVPSAPTNVNVKGYLQVDKQLISNADIKQATINFRLSADQLSEYSSPENVVLYRYHDGSWQELQTTFVKQDGSEYIFKAVTPGFSVFAIGEKQPEISVSGADLQRSSVTVGETVDVTAEVTNTGAGQGTYTVELTIDGAVVTTKTVTVPADATKTVTFSYTPSDAGTYDVAVNDTSAGTLEVTATDQSDEDETTTEQSPSTTTPGTDSGPSGGGPSGSLIALLLLVLLGGAGGALYYFRDEVEVYLETHLDR